MTFQQFAKLAKEDGWDLDDPAMAVTLAAYVVGPNIKRIAKFLGRSRFWCHEPAFNLREQGEWVGSRIRVGPDDEDGITLTLQACVAAGFLEVSHD